MSPTTGELSSSWPIRLARRPTAGCGQSNEQRTVFPNKQLVVASCRPRCLPVRRRDAVTLLYRPRGVFATFPAAGSSTKTRRPREKYWPRAACGCQPAVRPASCHVGPLRRPVAAGKMHFGSGAGQGYRAGLLPHWRQHPLGAWCSIAAQQRRSVPSRFRATEGRKEPCAAFLHGCPRRSRTAAGLRRLASGCRSGGVQAAWAKRGVSFLSKKILLPKCGKGRPIVSVGFTIRHHGCRGACGAGVVEPLSFLQGAKNDRLSNAYR